MTEIIMWILAACALLGGLDRLAGNRFGLGKRFEEGFMLLGPTALSMAGIICLAPVLTLALEKSVVPLWHRIGLDPAILGGILAIDMGGYQLASELANSPATGLFGGILVAATFGCTLTFTIPVGMGMLSGQDKPLFARGILAGLAAFPVALLVGGLCCGLGIGRTIVESLPILLLCVLMMVGIVKFPQASVRVFTAFAAFHKALTTLGLIAGAFFYITDWQPFPHFTPLEEAMAIVSSIGIVLLGSLPFAEILRRLLKRPIQILGQKTGLNDFSVAGFLMGIISPVPVFTLMKDMDARGKVANAAFLVCGASALAAHMGFTFDVARDFVPQMLLTKLIGGVAGAACALLLMRKKTP